MFEIIAVFSTIREKITGLSTLKVGGGENLLRVPTFLSGIVGINYSQSSRTRPRREFEKVVITRAGRLQE